MTYTIRDARFPQDADLLRQLFREYAGWLNVDLNFQEFQSELADLPGKYAPPRGAALIAEDADGVALGCVALRPLDDQRCEMKRMFLRDNARGMGVGRGLGQRVIAAARGAGYQQMVLDTLPHLTGAIRLYEKLGFRPIAPYYPNPLPGVLYLGLDLEPTKAPE